MPYGRSTLAVLTLFFLSQTFSFAYTMLPTLLTADASITPVQAGMILACATLFAGLWQPSVGRLLDAGRIGGSFALIAATYSLGIFSFLGRSSSLLMLLAGALGLSISMTTLRTLLGTALMGMIAAEHRPKMAGQRYLIANAALGVSGLIAFFWLDTHRLPLLLMDLLTTWLLGAAAVWMLRRHAVGKKPDIAASAPARGSAQMLAAAFGRFGWQISGLSLMSIGFLSHITYIPLFFAKGPMQATQLNATMLMVNTIGVTLLVSVVTRWSKRWRDGQRSLVSTLLMGFGLALTPLVPTLPGIIVATLIWTVGEVLFVPWQQAKFYDYLPQTQPGLASGALILLSSICMVIAPLIGTLLLLLPVWVASLVLLLTPFSGWMLYRHGETMAKGVPLAAASIA